MTKKISQAGFTLMEMIVYAAVVSIAFIIVGNIMLQITQAKRQLSTERLLQQQSIYLNNKLSYVVHHSAKVETLSPELVRLTVQMDPDTNPEYRFYKFADNVLWYAQTNDPETTNFDWLQESDETIVVKLGKFIVKDDVLQVEMILSQKNIDYNFQVTYAVRQPNH